MVRIRDVAWALAAAAVLAGSGPASADPITLTGNVANDFTAANGSVENPIALRNSQGQLEYSSTGQLTYTSGPGWVAGADGTQPNQLVSGADMQNIWFNYNSSTDTMYVGIQGFTNAAGQHEILGDISGNLNPALDANSNPNLGPISSATNTWLGDKSIALAFAPIVSNAAGQTSMGTPSIVAGIPAIKPSTTTPDFMVAQYVANGSGLPFSFGTPIANGGSMPFNTTASTPDVEFTINNFSKISGINPANGFYIEGFNGMAGGSAGKSEFEWMQALPAPQGFNTPEPTTWMAWMLLAGGAGWRYRRRLAARA
jgi:hypothetical protein